MVGRVCAAAADTISTGSGESAGSAGEFLTPDSARDVLAILALGGLAWTPECGKTHGFSLFFAPTLEKPKENPGFWTLGPRAQGCASRARNPKGPQITPFCHQLGRHPTILHILSTRRRRISARISPDRSNPLNLIFLLTIFGPKMLQIEIFGEKKTPLRGTSTPSNRGWQKPYPGGPGGP